MKKLLERLLPGYPGDFPCPYCGSELEFDEDRIYAFHWTQVICGRCDKIFEVLLEIKKTYTTSKWGKNENIQTQAGIVSSGVRGT